MKPKHPIFFETRTRGPSIVYVATWPMQHSMYYSSLAMSLSMPAKTNCHCRLLVLNEFTQSPKTSQHPRPSAKNPSTSSRPIYMVYAQHEGQPRKLTKLSLIFWFPCITPQTLQNEAGAPKNETQPLSNRGPEASKIESRNLQDAILKDI